MAGPASLDIDNFLGKEAPIATASPQAGLNVDQFLGADTSPTSTSTSPPAPVGSYAGHLARLGSQSLAQGAIAGSTAPQALTDLFDQYVATPILSRLGSKATPESLAAARSPLQDLLKQAGVSNPPSFDAASSLLPLVSGEQPSGTGERYGSAALRGLGGAITSLPFGGSSAPALALTSGAAGGVSDEAAKDVGAPGWLQALIGVIPGLALGGWSGARAAGKEADNAKQALDAAAKQLSASKDTLEAAGAGDASSPIVQAKQATGQSSLLAQHVLNDFTEKSQQARDATIASAQGELALRQQAVADSREAVASSLGQSSTLQEAGEALQTHARDWLANTVPTEHSALWSLVDAGISPKQSVRLDAFEHALDSMSTKSGELQPLADVLGSSAPKALAKAYNGLTDTPTWQDVKNFRSVLGEAMSDPSTVNKIPRQNLSALYAGLTADMKVAANGAGLLKEFNDASTGSKQLFDLAEGPVARVVGSKSPSLALDPKPEDVASRLLSGGKKGASDLAALSSADFPVGELAAAGLRSESTPGKLWNGLSDEAKSTLVPDAPSRQAIESGIAEHADALAQAKSTTALASAKHDLDVADAKARLSFGPATLSSRADDQLAQAKQAKLAAQRSFDAATAAMPPPPSDQRLIDILHAVRSHPLGAGAGALIEHLASSGAPTEISQMAHLALGGLAGHYAIKSLEPLYQGAKTAVSRPGGLVGPAAAVGGAAANAFGSSAAP